MSESATALAVSDSDYVRLRERTLSLYLAITVISILAILALVGYSIMLGPLVGPGVESSFGFALALLFLFGALLFHVVDKLYRTWPTGRRVRVDVPPPVTDLTIARFLRVVVVVAAALAIAYVFAQLVS